MSLVELEADGLLEATPWLLSQLLPVLIVDESDLAPLDDATLLL